jgi:hypothetical protein
VRIHRDKRSSSGAQNWRDWLPWGDMTSSESGEMPGEWAPPTGPAHSDPAPPPGQAQDASAEALPGQAMDQVVNQPDAGFENPPPPSSPTSGDAQTADAGHTGPRLKLPLVIAGALLLGVLLVFLADWVARNIETLQLLNQIEKSEAAMGETQAATVAVARTAPQGTFPLPSDKNLPPDIASELEEISAIGRDAVAEAGEGIAAVSFLPWHSDLISAQASYLAHNLAWVSHLEAGSEEGEVLVRGDNEDISSTWEAAEVQIRAAIPIVVFPGISDKVEKIFEEGANESSGPTLEVSGPDESVSLALG